MFSIQELQSSTEKELLIELEKTRNEMIKIRINVKTKHNKDTSKVKKTKRYLAKILTSLKGADAEVQSTNKIKKEEKKSDK